MIATVLRVLAAERAAANAKLAVARGLRHAALIALAGLLVLAGAAFGLVAAYWGLREFYEPAAAAGLMAAILALAGLALLALRAFLSKRARGRDPGISGATPEMSAESLHESARETARTLGPVNTVALALLLGIAAGRNARRR